MSEAVRAQEAIYFVRSVTVNPKAEAVYVDFFIDSWPKITAKFPGMLLSVIVKGVSEFYDTSAVSKLETFWATVESKERESADRSFQQSIEGIKVNAAFAARSTGVPAFLASQ
mgnify:CR=1 FL=1